MGTLLLANAVVAFLYILLGWIGHQLSLTSGFATPIWPPAGIAIVAFNRAGPRILPGIFLGAYVIGGIIGCNFGVTMTAADLLMPAMIACGACLQPLVADLLAGRLVGMPRRLESRRDAVTLAMAVGPVSVLVSASVGTATLLLFDKIPAAAVSATWWTWWWGDLFGVALVVTLALFAPFRNRNTMLWRGEPLERLNPAAFACVVLMVVISFYAWSAMRQGQNQRSAESFDALVDDTTRLFQYRLRAYGRLLDGGAGLVTGSGAIERTEWAGLVRELNFNETLPGMVGLGLIVPVATADLDQFALENPTPAGTPMQIHPLYAGDEHFIVRFIEPLARNHPILGLDLAAETVRRETLKRARMSGHLTITPPLQLTPDPVRGQGFLLLRPVYRDAMLPEDGSPRRKALIGWVYAPFISRAFFPDVLALSREAFEIRIDDVTDAVAGGAAVPLYDSFDTPEPQHHPLFKVHRSVAAYDREWRLTFESTPAFEARQSRLEPILVLVAGLALSAMIGLQLTTITRRAEMVRRLVDDKTRELVTQEEHTRSIIDTAMVGIVLLDERGRILALNRATEPIFGHEPGDLIGRPLTSLMPVDFDPSVRRGREARQMTRRLRIEHADGGEVYVELQLNPWTAEGGLQRHTAILRDVTVRQRAEMRLRETEQRWNMALSGARIAVFDLDVASGRQVVSHTWLTLMGFPDNTHSETVSLRSDWLARVHPDDLELVLTSDRDCIEGRTERATKEYRVRMPDGSWRWMRSDAIVPERGPDGRGLRLLGVQTDITELKSALEAVMKSEAQFRATIDLAPVGMALLDGDCNLLHVNEALCRFCGHSQAELLGMRLSDLVPGPDRVIADADRALLAEGRLSVIQMERRVICKDGSEAWGLLNVSLSAGESGAFILQVQDITERRQMDQMKSNFVATVSHELRTPLTSIKGALGLVLGTMQAEVPAKAERLLSIALKNCDRLTMLVNDILDMEKISSGQTRFRQAEVSLQSLLEQAVAVNQPYGEELGVGFSLSARCQASQVRVDVDRFQQVMSNLMSNAAKFSPRGSTVDICCSRGQGMVRITVTDRGPGVPDEFRERIFLPFSQADSSTTREKGGTGLGLNITRQIVERLGGEIGFNNLETGCEFWFTLPEIAGAPAAQPRRVEASPLARGPVRLVLHIEDDRDFAEIFRSAFAGGAEVVSAATLAEARQLIGTRPFDLVVIDWELPDGNGIALLDEIAAAHPEAPICGLSARDSVEDPRVRQSVIKSRANLHEIVEILLGVSV